MPRRPKVKRPLTIADLPAPSTNRWVIRRKAEVIAAVYGGLASLEEVCRRYTLTVEDFLSWQSLIDRHGTTRVSRYRPWRFLKSVLAHPLDPPESLYDRAGSYSPRQPGSGRRAPGGANVLGDREIK